VIEAAVGVEQAVEAMAREEVKEEIEEEWDGR
jgi:hypothetical protein